MPLALVECPLRLLWHIRHELANRLSAVEVRDARNVGTPRWSVEVLVLALIMVTKL
jgi:hypothetical protein